MNIITVIPFHSGDAHMVIRLLDWIRELGPVNSLVLFIADSNVDQSVRQEILSKAEIFREPDMAIAKVPPKMKWPQAANMMFDRAARTVYQHYSNPFLFLEPDAVPLEPLWMDFLNAEYDQWKDRKPFMGVRINNPVLHLSGVAVYPSNAIVYFGTKLFGSQAWDIACADILPMMHHTNLMQDFWGQSGLDPTFREKWTPDVPNCMTLDQIKKEAVLFHRNKDGTLIELLRKLRVCSEHAEPHKLNGVGATPTPATNLS